VTRPMKSVAATEWTHAAEENAKGRRRATSCPMESPACGPEPVVNVPVTSSTTKGIHRSRATRRKCGSRTSFRAPDE
jgi:hypothetical protein